ncbi:MAG: helix-turn-helix transcriptional regulator, partial [Bacteroidota bacterium]
RGEETYQVANRRQAIGEEQFLLVNYDQEVAVSIHDEKPVEGFCVFLSQDLMDEVYQHWQQAEERSLEEPASRNASFPGTFAARYACEQSDLGAYLQQLSRQQRLQSHDSLIEDKARLYRLAELLCQQQSAVHQQMNRLPSRKRSTREELFRRLSIAQEYLHSNWHLPPKMPEVAREAALSEYHFYRLFRAIYGQSPQRYLMALRLQKAYEMLRQFDRSITEVAEACGFYDVHHFNKAFRKHYGVKPSTIKK